MLQVKVLLEIYFNSRVIDHSASCEPPKNRAKFADDGARVEAHVHLITCFECILSAHKILNRWLYFNSITRAIFQINFDIPHCH